MRRLTTDDLVAESISEYCATDLAEGAARMLMKRGHELAPEIRGELAVQLKLGPERSVWAARHLARRVSARAVSRTLLVADLRADSTEAKEPLSWA